MCFRSASRKNCGPECGFPCASDQLGDREGISDFPQERIHEQVVKQLLDVSVPQIKEEIVEVVPIRQERISERLDERIVDVAAPQILEEIVVVKSLVSWERVQQRSAETSCGIA